MVADTGRGIDPPILSVRSRIPPVRIRSVAHVRKVSFHWALCPPWKSVRCPVAVAERRKCVVLRGGEVKL